MQKLYNRPENMVDDSINGFVKCYQNTVAYADHSRALKVAGLPKKGKVGIVSGGGAGHDPAFMGFLGKNMLDAVAIGNIFTPPSVSSFCAAFRAADSGGGVVCLCGYYPADITNAEQAAQIVAKEGICVKTIAANDDVAVVDRGQRRGAAGEILLWKIGGAAAARGYSQDKVVAVCTRALDRMRSIGVGLASCIIPEVGRPNYLIEMGTMEIGVGHHGQSSLDTCKLRSADATADIMLDEILKDMPLAVGDKVAVMISGLGNTMLSELNIVYSRVYDVLTQRGVAIHHAYIGNFFTSLDMMGITLTAFHLDDELTELMDMPAYPVALKNFS